MQEFPLITTIIPTFNRASRLKKAVESVLNQTFPHFELHVYDNASQDETEIIMEDFVQKDPRVTYFKHSENIGAVANFQFGMDRVETPFFSFLSDDDFLLPEFYQNALEGFTKYPQALFSYASVLIVNDDQTVIDDEIAFWNDQDYFSPPEGLFAMIKRHLNWTGILFRKEVVAKVGGLDLQLKAIDLDYLLRICASFPFAISKKASAIFVTHENSYSTRFGLKVIWPGWRKMTEKLNENSDLDPVVKEKALYLMKVRLGIFLFHITKTYVLQKKFSLANEALNIFKQNCLNNKKMVLIEKIVRFSEKSDLFHYLFKLLLKIKRSLHV